MLALAGGPGAAGSTGACSATRRGSRGGVPARKIDRDEMERIKAEIRGLSETPG